MPLVFTCRSEIPELGAQPGDTVELDPEHPTEPVLVVRGHGPAALPVLLRYVDHLTPHGPSASPRRLQVLLGRDAPALPAPAALRALR